MLLRRRSGLSAGDGSVPMPSGSRRRPALWLISGLGLVAFFLILGSGSANAETDPAAPSDQGLLGTVSEVGAGVTGTLAEQTSPVTDPVTQAVRDEVVKPVRDTVEPVLEPVVQPVRDRVVEPVTQPVRDAVKPVTQPVRDAVKPVLEPVVAPGATTDPATDPQPAPDPEPAPDPKPAPVPETTPQPAPTDAAPTSNEGGQAEATVPGEAVVPTPVSIDATTSTAADTAAVPTTDDRPVTSDRGGDDRQQQTPFQPTDGKAVVLTSSPTHSGSQSGQSGSGDNPAGAAAAVLPDSRADWHRATWSIRVVPADHVLPRSVAYRPGFSPD